MANASRNSLVVDQEHLRAPGRLEGVRTFLAQDVHLGWRDGSRFVTEP